MLKYFLITVLCFLISMVYYVGTVNNRSRQSNEIVVGTSASYQPFAFLENDIITGFDRDVMDAIANEIKINIEYRIVDNTIVGVETKEVDIGIGGIAITQYRKDRVNFTDPYYANSVVIVVGKDSDIETKMDLFGKKIGVIPGTTHYDFAMQITTADVIPIKTKEDLYKYLLDEKVDAIIIGKVLNDYFTKYEYKNKVKILGSPLSKEDNGFIVSKDNIELLNKINMGLMKIKSNGKFDKIYDKWINE